jgi:hypothetical protein
VEPNVVGPNKRISATIFFLLIAVCTCAGSTHLLTAVPGNISFGSQPVGSSSSQLVKVTNTGTKTEQVTAVVMSGSAAFSVSGWAGTVALAPSKSLNLTVSFSPSAVTTYAATLNVGGTASVSVAVPLSGSGATTTSNPVAVSVSPTQAVIQTSLSQQFTAPVTGTTNTAVTWSVNGVQGGNSTVGSISAAGLYTAPSAVPSGGSVTVTATSAADTTKRASGVVTIVAAPTPITVSITPTTATLQTGATQQFTATITGTTNTSVNWSVNGVQGGNSTVGTISPAGLYTAPAAVPSGAGVTVTSTSVYNPSDLANAAVAIDASSHYVSLSWTASVSSVAGYDIYRSAQASGPFTLINSAVNPGTTYTDNTIQPGQTYYYAVTAVSSSGLQGVYSNLVQATVP